MKIKTATLTDKALDWAVAEALGLKPKYNLNSHGSVWKGLWLTSGEYEKCPEYSTDWAQGGPILTEARISRTIDHSGLWIAYWTSGYVEGDAGRLWMQCDRSELVAGLRCFVALKFGHEVEIPDELLETK